MSGVHGLEGQNLQTNPRALIRQPVALQWMENGQIKRRTEGERQAGRFELFLDLLFVAILANFAEDLASHASGSQVVKYGLILTPAWHVWSDLRELMNSFYNDDLAQRTLILWVMALLVMYGNNAVLVEQDISAMRSAAGAYLAARVTMNTTHMIYSFASYHHRAQQRLWFYLSTSALLLYLPLFFTSVSLKGKIASTVVAIVVEESLWIFCYSPLAKRLLDATFTTAVDVPHEVDRFAAFFIIVLGEFLYQIVVGHPAAIGFNVGLLKAIWTLITAFCLNWLYVHNDGALKTVHPLRYNYKNGFAWVTLHLPMTASLLISGHVAALSVAEGDLGKGEVWLLCGGLGVGVLCLYIIALLHASEDEPKTLVLPKYARLILRPVSAIIILCLPLDSNLDATELLSINMSLLVLCVVWENVTSLLRPPNGKLWEKWDLVHAEHPPRVVVEEEVRVGKKEEAGPSILDRTNMA